MTDSTISMDLNGDVGEGFETDRQFIPLLTSANISCGAHAGDENSMEEAIRIALENEVGIGAHPGFADRENFGRKVVELSSAEITELVLLQLIKLQKLCDQHHAEIRHLKLHGALYHSAAQDERVAEAVIKAVQEFQRPLKYIIGQSDTVFERVVIQAGLKFVAEAFVDRAYDHEGRLLPRTEPGAVIDAPDQAIDQAIQIAAFQSVKSFDSELNISKELPIVAQTLCLHGDHAGAVELAHRIRDSLTAKNILLTPFGG